MQTQHLYILKPFFKKYWKIYALGILSLVVVDLLQVTIPRLTGQAIDSFARSDNSLHDILGTTIGITLLIAVLRYVHRVFIMGTTRRMEYYLREKLYAHALRLPLEFFDRHGPGKIMALTTNDITAVRVAVGLGIMLLVDAAVMSMASVIAMAQGINWHLTLLVIIPLPLILLAATLLGKSVHRRFRTVQEKFSNLTEFTQEMFAGTRVIKGFAAEGMALKRFAVLNQDNVQENMELAKLQAIYTPITHTAPVICYVIALYIGGTLIIEGSITIGDFAAFFGYLGLIIWPVMGLGYLINTVQRGLASLARIGDILAQPIYEDAMSEQAGALEHGTISIKGLTFAYPLSTATCLDNITLMIPEGAVVGVVGRTGSGKSTLLRLLLRLYDPPLQAIYIAGEEVHELDYLTLRQNIGYVPQDSMLFSQTIGENIAFDQSYPRNKILCAAKQAVIKETIDAKPQGFEAVLGEKGQSLSGGQQQRIAIARAMIKKSKIVLFDDIFSALDYHTQVELLANIKEFIVGRTTVIVSQRVNVVKEADFIIVLDNGRIVEQGTHTELVDKHHLYYELYEQQLNYGVE